MFTRTPHNEQLSIFPRPKSGMPFGDTRSHKSKEAGIYDAPKRTFSVLRSNKGGKSKFFLVDKPLLGVAHMHGGKVEKDTSARSSATPVLVDKVDHHQGTNPGEEAGDASAQDSGWSDLMLQTDDFLPAVVPSWEPRTSRRSHAFKTLIKITGGNAIIRVVKLKLAKPDRPKNEPIEHEPYKPPEPPQWTDIRLPSPPSTWSNLDFPSEGAPRSGFRSINSVGSARSNVSNVSTLPLYTYAPSHPIVFELDAGSNLHELPVRPATPKPVDGSEPKPRGSIDESVDSFHATSGPLNVDWLFEDVVEDELETNSNSADELALPIAPSTDRHLWDTVDDSPFSGAPILAREYSFANSERSSIVGLPEQNSQKILEQRPLTMLPSGPSRTHVGASGQAESTTRHRRNTKTTREQEENFPRPRSPKKLIFTSTTPATSPQSEESIVSPITAGASGAADFNWRDLDRQLDSTNMASSHDFAGIGASMAPKTYSNTHSESSGRQVGLSEDGFTTTTAPPIDERPHILQESHWKPLADFARMVIGSLLRLISRAINIVLETQMNQKPVEKDHVRVKWTCICGERMFDDFIETRPGAARELEQHLNRPRQRPSGSGSSSSGHSGSLSGSSMRTETTAASSLDPGDISNSLSMSRNPFRNPYSPSLAQSRSNSSLRSRIPPGKLWLMACADREKFTTKLIHLDMDSEKVRSDKDLALQVKREYSALRSQWRQWIRLRGLATIKFVQFELHRSHVVDIRKCPDLPPEGDLDYIFTVTPGLVPPVGEKYLMHLFHHPEDYEDETITYYRVPKKHGEKMRVRQSQDVEVGWGIHFVEAFLPHKIWAFMTTLFGFGSLVFGIVWTVKRDDIQGAFGVASWISALAILLMGCIMAYVE